MRILLLISLAWLAGLMAGIWLVLIEPNWEAFAAIGTCATALLAIAIPFWQQRQHRLQLMGEMASKAKLAAFDAEVIAAALKESIRRWRLGIRPEPSMFMSLESRCGRAIALIDPAAERTLLLDLVQCCNALQLHAGRDDGSTVGAVPDAIAFVEQTLGQIEAGVQAWQHSLGAKAIAASASSVLSPPTTQELPR